MGIAQGISAVPGISRMGMLICSGLLQGLRRESVAEYSLLLSLPTISAATLYQMYEDKEFAFFSLPSLFGFLVAFIVGLLCIKVLYNAVRRMSLTPFAIYCLALSLILWILL
jgi:undecaprenyl-diphosphatase